VAVSVAFRRLLIELSRSGTLSRLWKPLLAQETGAKLRRFADAWIETQSRPDEFVKLTRLVRLLQTDLSLFEDIANELLRSPGGADAVFEVVLVFVKNPSQLDQLLSDDLLERLRSAKKISFEDRQKLAMAFDPSSMRGLIDWLDRNEGKMLDFLDAVGESRKNGFIKNSLDFLKDFSQ
jgi:hypothetical protein